MANKSILQASDFRKQMRELTAEGNEELREIQQNPIISNVRPEHIDAQLGNDEAEVESYNKANKASQEKLNAINAGISFMRAEERESSAFQLADVQNDTDLVGQDVKADAEILRNALKAQPLLLKAIDIDYVQDLRKDLEKQLRRLNERMDKAWRRVADLDDPEFKAFQKRYEASFQDELSKVNTAAQESLSKLQGNVHSLQMGCQNLEQRVGDLIAELRGEKRTVESLQQEVIELTVSQAQAEGQRDSQNAIADSLRKQNNDLVSANEGLEAEVQRLRQELDRKATQVDLLLDGVAFKVQQGVAAGMQENARLAQQLRDDNSAKAAYNEKRNLPAPATRLTRTYSGAHGPGDADDDGEEVRPAPAKRPEAKSTTRRSAIPIRSRNLPNLLHTTVGSAASYRPRPSIKLGGRSTPGPLRPQQLSRSPGDQDDDLISMNKISQVLIDQMVLPANWTESDTGHMQQLFCQYQDSKTAQTQPQPTLDWCAKQAERGSGTCWFQKLLRHKAQFETVDTTQPCSGCLGNDKGLCFHVAWASDDQAAMPFDPASTQKRWVIQKRQKP